MTLAFTSSLEQQVDPEAIENFRIPSDALDRATCPALPAASRSRWRSATCCATWPCACYFGDNGVFHMADLLRKAGLVTTL